MEGVLERLAAELRTTLPEDMPNKMNEFYKRFVKAR